MDVAQLLRRKGAGGSPPFTVAVPEVKPLEPPHPLPPPREQGRGRGGEWLPQGKGAVGGVGGSSPEGLAGAAPSVSLTGAGVEQAFQGKPQGALKGEGSPQPGHAVLLTAKQPLRQALRF